MNTEPYFSRPGDTAPIYPMTDVMTPPPPPVARPPAGNGRRLALIVGTILALLALVTAALAFALPRLAQRSAPPDPLVVARAYCTSLTHQDGASAWSLFTPSLQTLLFDTRTYTAVAGVIDAQGGTATTCAPAPPILSKDGSSADVPLVVTRARNGEGQIDLHLTRAGNSWRIAQAPDLALLPFTTEYVLCLDLRATPPDAQAAFRLFSTRLQHTAGSPADFQRNLGNVEAITGPIINCQIQGFTLNPNGISGVFTSGTTFKNFANIPTELKLSADATGAWLIDAFVIKIAGFPLQLPTGQG